MIGNSNDYQTSNMDGKNEKKALLPSLMMTPYESNQAKAFCSLSQDSSQVNSSFRQNQLWNNSVASLISNAENSGYSGADSQFQLPDFINHQLYHPTPVKHSMQNNLSRLQDMRAGESGAIEPNTISSSFSNYDTDYFTPETMDKLTLNDPFKTKMTLATENAASQSESNYSQKKRYTVNSSTGNYAPFNDARGRAIETKQPLISQYAARNPSHGNFGYTSQGALSQGPASQGTASSRNNAHSMVSPHLLQYQTSHTSMRSADEDSLEAMKIELLFKEQVNKTLNGKLSELKTSYDKLKSANDSSHNDQVQMPTNFHHLFKDLTRTLNERTLELDETKARLEAVLVGLVMSKDKTITDHGSFDAQELAHRITNKMNVLSCENKALLNMVSFSNKQSLMVELGLLRNENKALKEKLKESSQKNQAIN
ncbi:hypothetical protein PUMCH_002335 [Australozyma saopauloensis]|uniref:Protein MUM2 n=1 Tax=Australozyma saopauloensis TaxID=291208 RepID=A0AAX4H9E8_9ASCO|nr:hypothetical protein PUMCH_002335 [[Candida] saopauloensis]